MKTRKKQKVNYEASQRKRKMVLLLLSNMNVNKIQDKPIKKCSNELLFLEFENRSGQSFQKYYEISTALKNKKKQDGRVYVIGNLEYGFIKIGFSTNVTSRLDTLQTACPFELMILSEFKASHKDEKKLHSRFKEYNTRGEWFRYEGDVAEYFDFEGELERKYIQA